MRERTQLQPLDDSVESIVAAITRLARESSIEINAQDAKHLDASRAFLRPGQKIYVSHLPGQTWENTQEACRSVHEAGFDPVPHLPVRLVENASTLDRILSSFVCNAKVREVLLISGDYTQATGPYSCVSDVLAAGFIAKHGMKRVSVAGHPEGHSKVPLPVIRRAERDKAALAQAAGMEIALVTQFFFESGPFLAWASDLQTYGVKGRVVAGIAGPAGLATLFKFALRCGVGPSVRALGIRPISLTKLMGDYKPDRLTTELARALVTGTFDGLHLFCFGGFLRACEWIHRIANGQFTMNANGGFDS